MSIDPKTKMTETLGSLLSSRFTEAGAEKPDFVLPSKGLTENLDSAAAVVAFTPGWDSAEIGLGEAKARSKFTVTVDEGIEDLSLPSLRALSDYTKDLSKGHNKYFLDTVQSDPSGHRKGSALLQGGRGGKSFQKDQDFEIDNSTVNKDQADTIIADNRFNQTSRHGFFNEIQLQELLTKDHSSAPFSEANVDGDEKEDATNPNGPYDGNDVLRRIFREKEGPDDGTASTTLPRAIQKQLQSKNRFSPNPPDDEGGEAAGETPYMAGAKSGYLVGGSSEENEEVALTKGMYGVQTGQGTLGKFDKNAPKVTVEMLKRLALSTMLQAGGHTSLGQDPDLGKVARGKFTTLADIAALAPSVTQLGIARVDQLTATRIKYAVAEDGINSLVGPVEIARGLNIADEDTLGDANDSTSAFYRLRRSAGQDDLITVQGGDRTMGAGPDGPNDSTGSPQNSSTYGTMNTFLEHFDGPLPFGMFFITLYGMLISGLTGSLVEGLADDNPRPQGTHDNPSSLTLGSADNSNESIVQTFMRLFGWPRVTAPTNFARCMMIGLMHFYGVPKPVQNMSLEDFLQSAINIALAPGYYATVTKQILRDFEQITGAAMAFGGAMSVFLGITQVFKLIDALVTSTTFNFITTMIKLGNIAFHLDKMPGPNVEGGHLTGYKAQRDLYKISGKNRLALSRFFGGAASLRPMSPLSLHMHPSALLMPGASARAFVGIGQLRGEEGSFAAAEGLTLKPELTDDGGLLNTGDPLSWIQTPESQFDRISQKTVKLVEQALEVEYVPFYFQDLRTNEIIAMPAFVTSISDDFSVDYTESDGYGRTDAVKIYNKTSRAIGLTFKLVAMNENDQDFMWYIINKLVAMCYPQRSMGRVRTYGDDNKNRFVQPFSQVPTASPVIRIRLGELLHSNYSAARMANLFGHPGALSINQSEESDITTIRKNMVKRKGLHRTTAEVAVLQRDVYEQVVAGEYLGEVLLRQNTTVLAVDIGDAAITFKTKGRLKCEIGEWINREEPESTETDAEGSQVKVSTTWAKVKITPPAEGLKATGIPPASIPTDILDDTGVFFGEIRLSDIGTGAIALTKTNAEEVENLLNDRFPDAESQEADATDLENFFKPENNAIIRAFHSTMGKGLAGVITSMGLNYDGATWETKLDTDGPARAPKHVEITLAFSPIHDLPLGLDYRGNLIAPSHPAGKSLASNPYDTSLSGAPIPAEGSTTPNEIANINKAAAAPEIAVAGIQGNAPRADEAPASAPSPMDALMGSLPISLPSLPGFDLNSLLSGDMF